MPIKAIIFPKYIFQSETKLSAISPSNTALKLLENCVNFTNHKQVAIQKICNFVNHLPAFELFFSHEKLATEALLAIL